MPQPLILKQRIPRLENPVSVLDYMAARFTYKPSGQWLRHIEEGCVFLDGQKTAAHTVLRGGEELQYQPAPFTEPPVCNAYGVIFEDNDLLVINKPAPLPVMSIRKYQQHSLMRLLETDFPSLKLFPVHRLDLETSGVVLFAKSSAAASHLGKQFIQKTVHKTYLAVVQGSFPDDLKFLSSFLQRLPDRPHFMEAPSGMLAETRVQCLQRGKTHSLLELQPLTGRTHQLRVQLAARGHAIVGDKRYIDYPHSLDEFLKNGMSEMLLEKLGAARQMLHAWKIEICHPLTGQGVQFTAKIPEDFMMVP